MTTTTANPKDAPFLQPHQIILRPLVTEKGMHRSTRYNAYAFEVNRAGHQGRCSQGGRRTVRREGDCACTCKTAKASRAATSSAAAARKTGKRPSSRWIRNTGSTSSKPYRIATDLNDD